MRKLFSIAVAIVLFISACTKIESTTIGNGLIPPIDGVTTLDTILNVYTNNYYDLPSDSIRVYKNDDHVIGKITNDPLFGKTYAETYLELKPTFYRYSFPAKTTLKADSAVLVLSYKGYYGDNTIPQNWEVYSLGTSIKGDSAYDITQQFAVDKLLGTKTIDITKLPDSVTYGFEQATNQIRIKLSSQIAKTLIEDFDTTALQNGPYDKDSLFRVNFKGLVVRPTAGSGGNALVRINLLDTNTKLALYYNYKQADTATAVTKAVNYFRFDQNRTTVSGSANYIKRDHTGSAFAQNVNTSVNDTSLFIQTAPGTMATIRIPGLDALQNRIVHRAELVTLQFPEAPMSPGTKFDVPQFLLLSSYDSSRRIKTNIPNDFVISSNEPNFLNFGGYSTQRDVEGVIVRSYIFDVSRYVQGIVTRKDKNLTLRLSAPANDSLRYTEPYPLTTSAIYYVTSSTTNPVATGRVRLGGGGMAATNPFRMRLRIIYSRI